MPRYLIKLGDYYFEWSTVVDAPISYAMTRDELEAYIRLQYGEQGVRALPSRMARVDAHGTSALGMTVEEVIAGNRAGDDEEHLSADEIIAQYTAPVERSAPRDVRGQPDEHPQVI